MNDNFHFSTQVSLQKGIDGQEPKELIIAGIASTSSQDFDGEFMNPKGFDTSYFEKFGFVNWSHQTNKDPLAIVGRPTEVEIDVKANELFIETKLFKSSEKARQVYKLGEILEAEGYALAYSIEGKVIERDKKDPRKVLRAKITGCAITPTPKNNDSSANLVKGLEGSDNYEFIKSMLSEETDEDEELKKKKKKKAMDSASVKPLTKESVDKKTKDTVGMLTKGQVLTILREDLPNTSEEMLEEVYKLTLTIEKSVSMETPEVSPESLAKAYETLDITKGTDAPVAEVTDENPTQEAEEGATTETPVVEETPVTEEAPVVEETGEVSEDTPSEEAIEASKTILKSIGLEVVDPKATLPVTEKKPAPVEAPIVEKGIGSTENPTDFTAILREELGNFSKGNTEKFGAISTLFKGMEAKIDKADKRNSELEELIKGFGEASQGRRSLTTAAAIEKGAGGTGMTEETPAANLLSISNPSHKAMILKKGDDASGLSAGNISNPHLAEEVAMYESSNFIDPQGMLAKSIAEAGFALTK